MQPQRARQPMARPHRPSLGTAAGWTEWTGGQVPLRPSRLSHVLTAIGILAFLIAWTVGLLVVGPLVAVAIAGSVR